MAATSGKWMIQPVCSSTSIPLEGRVDLDAHFSHSPQTRSSGSSAKEEEIARHRKSLVSTGDRSAKIRTYNFPQGRVTDHRIGLTVYNLDDVLNGNVQEFIDGLQFAENAEKMAGQN